MQIWTLTLPLFGGKSTDKYRLQEAGWAWSRWRPTPDTGELDYPNEARGIEHPIA
jgi:hypothetical protein